MQRPKGNILQMPNLGTAAWRLPSTHQIITCEEQVEEAIQFLVESLAVRSRKGKKPVVLHSIRVGFNLLSRGYPTSVVIAGLLHDILEKTILTPEHLARRFGKDTAAMVAANTVNRHIADPIARYCDSLERCADVGPGALLVRAADLLDNYERQLSLGNFRRLGRIAEKLQHLNEVCQDELDDDSMLNELERCWRRAQRFGR